MVIYYYCNRYCLNLIPPSKTATFTPAPSVIVGHYKCQHLFYGFVVFFVIPTGLQNSYHLHILLVLTNDWVLFSTISLLIKGDLLHRNIRFHINNLKSPMYFLLMYFITFQFIPKWHKLVGIPTIVKFLLFQQKIL